MLWLVCSVLICYAQSANYRLERILNAAVYFPEDIAIDGDGFIYVLDYGKIVKFDTKGNYISAIDTETSDTYGTAVGIDIDSEGNFYVLKTSSAQVQKFSRSGELVMQFGSMGTANGQFMYPSGIAIDPSGNIYVADTDNNRVQKFSKTGVFISQIGLPGNEDGQFSKPKDIGSDKAGNIYVVDSGNYRIQKFNSAGQPLLKFGLAEWKTGFYQHQSSIVVGNDGSIYVGDPEWGRVVRFDSNGEYLSQIGRTNQDDIYYFDGTKISVTLDASGNVYAADRRHNGYSYIHKFDSSGQSTYNFGTWSREDGKFHEPTSVAFDEVGNLYVADAGNFRIQKFNKSGQFISKFGTNGSADGQFILSGSLRDIAVDIAGNVYALESTDSYARIQKFDAYGRFIRKYDNFGPEAGYSYTGIAVDLMGNMYVSELYGGCVRKISADGQFFQKIGTWGKEGNGQLFIPHDVAVDRKGDIYVLDSESVRIQKFNKHGEFIKQFVNFHSSYATSSSMDVDNNGFLYITCATDGFMQIYDSLVHPVERIKISTHSVAVSRNGYKLAAVEYLQDAVFLYSFPQVPQENLITGTIYEDANKNCQKDASEKGISGIVVTAEPGPYYGVSDEFGKYSIPVDTGTYTIRQLLPKQNGRTITQSCPATPHTAHFTSYSNIIYEKDFANQADLQPFLAVDISSDRRRRCFTSQTVVYYRNEGFASASNVQIKVVYPEYVIPISSTVPWKRRQGDTLFFELNTLLAYSSGNIVITDSVACGNESIRGLTQCTQAIITPGNQISQDSRWDQSSLALFATCKDNGFVRLVIKNTGNGNMTDSTAYRIFLDAQLVFSANCKVNKNDSLVLEVPVNGKTIRLEADQRPYHPGESRPSITLEGCGSSANVVISKGFVDQLPQDDAAEEIATSCMQILDSYDPNDKQASPSGPSDTHMIRKDDELEYTIRFQNTGTDVAYTVVIEDELHENLDVATLRMGASSHPNTWKISGEGKPKITWTFHNINLPDSSTNEKGSHGFVSFRIRQKEDNPIGASIANQAFIFFDFNSPIATNVVYHTVGELPLADAKVAVNICDGSKPDSAIAGDNILLTEQSSTQLHANLPGKGYGHWKLVSGTATIVNPEDPHTLITDLGAGKNVFEWTIYFCSQVSASQVTIERVVIPTVPVVSNPAPYCTNDVIQPLLAQGQNIEWFTDETLQTLLATGEIYQPTFTQTDTLYVIQTISGYRSMAQEIVVTIQAPVAAPVVPATVYYCKPDESISISAEGENIEWFTDATLQTKAGSGTDVSITVTENTDLYVTQQVNGCRSTPASISLKAGVFKPKQILITNVITPNGDDKNEAFTAPEIDSDSCIGQFRYVQIFNRYGKKVFESHNEQFAWNGSGTSTGVYYYILSYSGFTYSGTVSVLY